jgi:hypothetical protein
LVLKSAIHHFKGLGTNKAVSLGIVIFIGILDGIRSSYKDLNLTVLNL